MMTPSSCSTAPSGISSHVLRSIVRVIMARLRMRDVAMGPPLKLLEALGGCGSSGIGERLLLGKGTVYLVAQMLRQLNPKPLALGRKQVAWPRQINGYDRLDLPGPRRKHQDAVGKRHCLVDVVRDKQN